MAFCTSVTRAKEVNVVCFSGESQKNEPSSSFFRAKRAGIQSFEKTLNSFDMGLIK
jgi:hypothetical protein